MKPAVFTTWFFIIGGYNSYLLTGHKLVYKRFFKERQQRVVYKDYMSIRKVNYTRKRWRTLPFKHF